MNGQTIKKICDLDYTLSPQFQGVYSSDNLPNRIYSFPSAYIVNTTEKHRSGEHWLALYFYNPWHACVFDSYGRVPSTLPSSIYKFINRNSHVCTFNPRVLQQLHSQTCGFYSILFLLYMSRGYNLNTYLALFSLNTKDNDFVVYHCLYSIFKK